MAMISFAYMRKHPVRPWHHVRLDATPQNKLEQQRMALAFNWFYMAAGRPRGMNLWFVTHDDGGADAYLSPRSTRPADKMIQHYQAQPCEPPAQRSDNAWILIAGDGYGHHEPVLFDRIVTG